MKDMIIRGEYLSQVSAPKKWAFLPKVAVIGTKIWYFGCPNETIFACQQPPKLIELPYVLSAEPPYHSNFEQGWFLQ